MGNAFKCDLSGTVEEGKGLNNFMVALTDKISVQVTPLVKTGVNQFGQGVICQESADKITAALSGLKIKES